MPPAPVLLLTALMIGYPLVQIAAIALRRSKRLRFNALCRDMLADPSFNDDERRVVDWLMKDSRGGLDTLTAPLTLSATVFRYTTNSIRVRPWTEDVRSQERSQLAPGLGIWRDPRTRMLGALSMQLEMATYPLTTLVTAIAATLAWLVAALIMLLRGSLPAKPPIRELVSASGHMGGLV